jgi:molecular chaperone GrpE
MTAPCQNPTDLDALSRELALLRKTLLRQGHAQELFQARVEEAVARLAAPGTPESGVPPALGAVQVRVLIELDQAVLQLLRLAAPETYQPSEDTPRSLREGLSLLQIRVRNLQRSLGLEPVPARDLPFDDQCHEACGVVERTDLPDGWVAEEILPGYRVGRRLVRPARVVVNRRP